MWAMSAGCIRRSPANGTFKRTSRTAGPMSTCSQSISGGRRFDSRPRPRRRSRPVVEPSTPATRSSSLRFVSTMSFTLTSFTPWVSTICLSRMSRPNQTSPASGVMTGRHRASCVDVWCSKNCGYGCSSFVRAQPKRHREACLKVRRRWARVNRARLTLIAALPDIITRRDTQQDDASHGAGLSLLGGGGHGGGALLVRVPALGIAAAGLLILFVGAMLVREWRAEALARSMTLRATPRARNRTRTYSTASVVRARRRTPEAAAWTAW